MPSTKATNVTGSRKASQREPSGRRLGDGDEAEAEAVAPGLKRTVKGSMLQTKAVLVFDGDGPDFKDQARSVTGRECIGNDAALRERDGADFVDQERKEGGRGYNENEALLRVRAHACQPIPTAEAIQIFDTNAAVPKDLLCPISGETMQDPVVLFPSGITYDKKNLCQLLISEPDVDPFTSRRHQEKLRYCDNVLVQRMLIRELGRSAYQKFDDSSFRDQYDQAWAQREVKNRRENGVSPELYKRIESLMFGMNRARIDMDVAFALTACATDDAILVAYRAWFVDPEASNVYAVSCAKDKCVADRLWKKAASLGLTDLANSGNPFAEFLEGQRLMYNTKNKWKAFDWFRAAANHGHFASKWALAEFYRKHGSRDYTYFNKAKQLYLEAAGEGHCAAQANLGIMYMDPGENKNYKIAANYFRMAAEQGDDHGQFCLAWMYQTGSGVPQDFASAAFWYERAADQGHMAAKERLGRYGKLERANL